MWLGILFTLTFQLERHHSMGLQMENTAEETVPKNFCTSYNNRGVFCSNWSAKEPTARSLFDRLEERALTANDGIDRLRHTEMTSSAESNWSATCAFWGVKRVIRLSRAENMFSPHKYYVIYHYSGNFLTSLTFKIVFDTLSIRDPATIFPFDQVLRMKAWGFLSSVRI